MILEDGAESNGNELLFNDLFCSTCGYRLTGLKPGGDCPECGSSIQKTIDSTDYANRKWLTMTGWGLIAQLLLTCFSLVEDLIYSMMFSSSAGRQSPFFILHEVWRYTGPLLHLGAAILLTWPRPRNVSRLRALRWITITLAVTYLLSSQLIYFLQSSSPSSAVDW